MDNKEQSNRGLFHSNDPEIISFLQQLLQFEAQNAQQNLGQRAEPKQETPEASLNETANMTERFSYLAHQTLTPPPENMNPHGYGQAPANEPFSVAPRMELIGMKEEPQDRVTSQKDPNVLKPFDMSSKIVNWAGGSIYGNLPESAKHELDKILKSAHLQKVEVIKALNAENPVRYDYNPKKSRKRLAEQTSYRERNNLASRRSRQRKKFSVQIKQYNVDYEIDDNFLMIRQMNWMESVIKRFEGQVLANGHTADQIRELRSQCGLE